MKSSITNLITIIIVMMFFNIGLLGQTTDSTVTDFDGNVYHTINIGSQTWLKENLKSLHYCDGTEIPDVVAYKNLDSLTEIYERLYTWDAAMRGTTEPGTQGVCPCEWHLPTSAEWAELENFLGGPSVAGGKMKEAGTEHWLPPNTGATNSSGFTGLPAGEYDTNQGAFLLIHEYAVFWTSTSINNSMANERYLAYDNAASNSLNWYKTLKYSIRCVKDETTSVDEIGDNSTPVEFDLFQNFPNPFNPTTNIQYAVSNPQFVSIKVYDVLGNEVATLVNEEKPAGSYKVEFSAIGGSASGGDAYTLPSGFYFYKLEAGDYIVTKKMVLLK